MQRLEKDLLEGGLYCQVDSLHTLSDFAEGTCVRLIGVAKEQFNAGAFGEGVRAIVIDIPIDQSPFPALGGFCEPDDCAWCHGLFNEWLHVTFRPYDSIGQFGLAQVYPCFGEALPLAASIHSIEFVSAPFSLPAFPRFVDDHDQVSGSDSWTCSSFTVGQGMASLVYNESDAYLLDAGAGTPIRRAAYVGNKLRNQLSQRVLGRKTTFVLSHGDEDHWRILRWDASLRGAIRKLVIPANRPRIAFFDADIKSRVTQLDGDARLKLGPHTTLALLRTNPSRVTSNNDGIVAVFNGKKKVLFPGDCVYDEMQKDQNSEVQALVSDSYDGVVVPHHGDLASSHGVPTAAQKNVSTAFFSAGNHAGYKHPHRKSRASHVKAGYKKIVKKTPKAIVEHVF